MGENELTATGLSTDDKSVRDAGVVRALERLDIARREVAARMIERSASEVPEYAQAVTPERREEMLRHGEDTLALLSEGVRGGGGFSDRALDFVRANAELRAEQGFPLPAILHAYRVGQSVIAEFDPALAAPAIDLLNAISTALTESYLRRRHELDSERDRRRGDLLDALLAGGPRVGQVERMRAAELGISGAGGLLVAVVCGPPSGSREAMRRAATELESAASSASPLVALRGEEAAAVIPMRGARAERARAWAEDAMRRTPGESLRAGISGIVPHLDELPRAHRDAVRASGHAPPGSVRSLADVPLVDLLVGEGEREDVRRLAPWVPAFGDADRSGTMAATLDAYFEGDLNVVGAAAKLGLHPNTVRYRLRRIRDLTGLDPRRFGDAVELLVGLRALAAGGPPA